MAHGDAIRIKSMIRVAIRSNVNWLDVVRLESNLQPHIIPPHTFPRWNIIDFD